MVILGISCYYHESAAALLVDGKIVAAAEEERFTRIKHDASFPARAIDFVLDSCNLKASDITYVVFYEKPFSKFERNISMAFAYFPRSRSFFVESMMRTFGEKLWIKGKIAEFLGISQDKIYFVPHHISHAAASYYSSPFEHAAFLTLDAVGEWATGSWGKAVGNRLYPQCELRFPHSVGLLYSAVTSYLGFEVNDGEYKVMGMAGYGKPVVKDKVKMLFRQLNDGSIRLNLDYFAFHYSTHMYTKRLTELFYGVDRFDLAASLQHVTEDIIYSMLTYVAQKTKEKNLVYGGGVALNSVVNGSIIDRTPFRHVYVYPSAGDDGGAVGCALYFYHHVLGNDHRYECRDMYLGASYTTEDIVAILRVRGEKFRILQEEKKVRFIADSLVKGKVVGWFEGRAEFGPRALGHRSILADPRKPNMKDIVNQSIKFREEFRPFAPMILSEHTDTYFRAVIPTISPFMLGTFQATSIAKRRIPAVIHVDNTSRVQSVEKNTSGSFRKVLSAFYKQTGVPVLLNTSFNLKGEPIVNSPIDAIQTYHNSGLNILVMERCILEKDS